MARSTKARDKWVWCFALTLCNCLASDSLLLSALGGRDKADGLWRCLLREGDAGSAERLTGSAAGVAASVRLSLTTSWGM